MRYRDSRFYCQLCHVDHKGADAWLKHLRAEHDVKIGSLGVVR